MVECGIPMSTIYKKCNELKINLSEIESCLITHLHRDHSLSAKDLYDRNIPILASKDTLESCKVKGQVLIQNKPNYVLNGLFVFPFEVEHDVEGAFGFILKTAKETVMFINDCKKWDANLINFKPNYVFIECNYENKMVYAQINELQHLQQTSSDEKELKEANITLKQFDRNTKAHMSLLGCIKGLKKLNLSRCNFICLMHLSDRYANEYKMKNEVQLQTGVTTYVAGKNGGIK